MRLPESHSAKAHLSQKPKCPSLVPQADSCSPVWFPACSGAIERGQFPSYVGVGLGALGKFNFFILISQRDIWRIFRWHKDDILTADQRSAGQLTTTNTVLSSRLKGTSGNLLGVAFSACDARCAQAQLRFWTKTAAARDGFSRHPQGNEAI